MTLKEIMAMDYEDISGLKKEDLKDILKVTRHGIRNRKNRIKSSEYKSSIALSNYTPKQLRGLSYNQLRAELRKDLDFLNDKTSTLGGVRSVNKDLNRRLGVAIRPKDMSEYWKVYNRLKEEGRISTAVMSRGSEQLQQMLASVFNQQPEGMRDPEKIYEQTRQMWNDLYEESAAREAEMEEEYDEDFYELEDEEDDDEVFF